MKILLMALVVAGMVGTLTPTQADSSLDPYRGSEGSIEFGNTETDEEQGEDKGEVWHGRSVEEKVATY